MKCRLRLRDTMATIAVIGIYLAALHTVTLGPSGNACTTWQQLVSLPLLIVIMPFHIMAAGESWRQENG